MQTKVGPEVQSGRQKSNKSRWRSSQKFETLKSTYRSLKLFFSYLPLYLSNEIGYNLHFLSNARSEIDVYTQGQLRWDGISTAKPLILSSTSK